MCVCVFAQSVDNGVALKIRELVGRLPHKCCNQVFRLGGLIALLNYESACLTSETVQQLSSEEDAGRGYAV